MRWRNQSACSWAPGAVTTGPLARLVRDERGMATVEFVLWLPVFATVMLVAIDATVLYLHHTEMWNVARDVARRVAVGDIDENEAKQYVVDNLFLYTHSYWVHTSDPSSEEAMILIQTRVSDASMFGLFGPILDEYLEAAVVMRKEPM